MIDLLPTVDAFAVLVRSTQGVETTDIKKHRSTEEADCICLFDCFLGYSLVVLVHERKKRVPKFPISFQDLANEYNHSKKKR